MDENRKKLYDQLSQNWNVGTWEEFDRDLDDENNMRVAWDAVGGQDGYGDFDLFKQSIQRSPQQEVVNQQVPQWEQQPTMQTDMPEETAPTTEVTPTIEAVETKVEEKPKVDEPKVEVTDTEQEQTTTTELAPATDVTPVEQPAPKVDYTAMSDADAIKSIDSIEDADARRNEALVYSNQRVQKNKSELASKRSQTVSVPQDRAEELGENYAKLFQQVPDGEGNSSSVAQRAISKYYDEYNDNIVKVRNWSDEQLRNAFAEVMQSNTYRSDEERAVAAIPIIEEMNARASNSHAMTMGEREAEDYLSKHPELRANYEKWRNSEEGFNSHKTDEATPFVLSDMVMQEIDSNIKKAAALDERRRPNSMFTDPVTDRSFDVARGIDMSQAMNVTDAFRNVKRIYGSDNYESYVVAFAARHNMSVEAARQRVDQLVYLTVGERMKELLEPKDSVEYFLRKALYDNYAANIGRALYNMATSKPGDVTVWSLEELSMQGFEQKNLRSLGGQAVIVGATLTSFANDMLGGGFTPAAIAGGTAGRATARLLGKDAATVFWKRLTTGGASGAFNFAVFDTQCELLRQLRTGDYSGYNLTKSFFGGMEKGAAFGVVGESIGRLFWNSRGWMVPVGEAVKLVGEAATFSTIGYLETGQLTAKDWATNFGMALSGRLHHASEYIADVRSRMKNGRVHKIDANERAALAKKGYGNIADVLHNGKLNKSQLNVLEGELENMRNDKSVSWETIRLAEFALNGRLLPAPPMTDFKAERDADNNWVFTPWDKYGDRAIGGSVTVKGTDAKNKLQAELSHQCEKNAFILNEAASGRASMQRAIGKAVISWCDETPGYNASSVYKLYTDAVEKINSGEELGDFEKEVFDGVNKKMKGIEVPDDVEDYKKAMRDEGYDLDKILAKPNSQRSTQERAALERYKTWLDGRDADVRNANESDFYDWMERNAIQVGHDDAKVVDEVKADTDEKGESQADETDVRPEEPEVSEDAAETEGELVEAAPETPEAEKPEEPEPPTETPPTAPEGEPTGEGESISEPLDVGNNELPIKEAPENLAGGKAADTHDIAQLFPKAYAVGIDADMLDTYLESAERSRKEAHDYAEGKTDQKPRQDLWDYWAERDGLKEPEAAVETSVEQEPTAEQPVQPTEQEPSATPTEEAPENTATVESTPEAKPEVEATEQPNVEEQRRNAEEAARKRAQAADPYYMPMENKGGGRMSPDYDKASAEQIFNHLNDRENREQRGTLSADIEQRLKDAQARLASIEKQEPKGNNRTTSALNAWERRRDAAADRVEKWKEVKRMHDENQRTNGKSELDDRQARKVFFETDPGEAGSLREYVMRQLYGMKFKWKGLNYERTGGRTSGLGGHLGLESSEKERRGFFGWLDEKNGMTPEEAAHSIWESMPQEWSDRYDTMEILDEVLSVVGDFPRPMDMVRDFAKNHRSMADEQADWDAGQMGYKDAGEAEADMEQQERDMASRHDALAAENEANEETADKVAELQQIANDPNRSEFERQAARSALRWRQLPDAERKRRTPLIERVKKWTRKIGGDGVVVLHGIDEIQDAYTRRMVEQAHANGQRTPGWYDKGKVYIFMPDVTDRRDVDKTMVHEVVSHKGIKGLLGEAAYNDLLDAVYASMSIEAKDEYSHYIGGKENETEVEHHRRMADEWIANNLEGTRVDNKFAEAWNNIAKYVLDTLRGWGFDISNVTKTDLEHLLRQSYKNLRKNAEKGEDVQGDASIQPTKGGKRYRFVGEKGAANQDKADGGERMKNHDVAEEMERDGKDARTVKLATGWERGTDGKWRYEEPDIALNDEQFMKFVQHEGTAIYWGKLGDLVGDNELFEAYPELKNTIIYSNTDGDNHYDPKHNELALATNVVWSEAMQRDYNRISELRASVAEHRAKAEEFKDRNPRASEIHAEWAEEDQRAIDEIQGRIEWMHNVLNDALVHEVQHAIQEIEGFAKGGSPRDFGGTPTANVVANAIADRMAAERVIEDGDTVDTLRAKYEERKGKEDFDSKTERGVLADAIGILSEGFSPKDVRDLYAREEKKLWDAYNDESPESPFGQYSRLAGEVESRNVSKRMNMTDDQRRSSLASETEDVPRDEQIVRDGYGVNMMGSRVNKRMEEIDRALKGRDLTDEQRKVVSVFSGKADKTIIFANKDGAELKVEIMQGGENKAGSKHAIFRHYGTKNGYFTSDDILLIPEIIRNGERIVDGKKVSYDFEKDGVKYTFATELKGDSERMVTFYTDRKAPAELSQNTSTDARTNNADAHSADKGTTSSSNAQEENVKTTDNSSVRYRMKDDEKLAHRESVEQGQPLFRVKLDKKAGDKVNVRETDDKKVRVEGLPGQWNDIDEAARAMRFADPEHVYIPSDDGKTLDVVDWTDNQVLTIWRGKPGSKRYEKWRERVLNHIHKQVPDYAKKLGLDVELIDNEADVPAGHENDKSWYDPETGKITIVVPRHGAFDTSDVFASLWHEGVAKEGLRKLVGEKNYDNFLDNVYNTSDKDIKGEIERIAAEQYDGDNRAATQEYISRLAEQMGFEHYKDNKLAMADWMERGIKTVRDCFENLCKKLGIWDYVPTLRDDDLRAVLWNAHNKMEAENRNAYTEQKRAERMEEKAAKENADMDVVNIAAENGVDYTEERPSVADARRRLEDPNASEFEKTAARTVLRAYGGGDTPDGGNTVEDSGVRYRIKDDAERMTGEVVYKNRQARQRKEAVADFVKAVSDLDEMTDSKFATALSKVMRGQREYDKDTVKDITDMAKAMMDAGLLSDLDDFAVKQILTKVKDATGKNSITAEANKLIDIMLKHQLKKGKSEFEKSLKVKGMKQDSRGVVVQAGLDYHGQRMVKALKEALGLSDLQAVNDRIDEVEQKLNDPDEVVRGNAKDELDGLYIARQYFDEIKQNEINEANVKTQLEEAKTRHKNGGMSDAAYHQFVWSCEDALRELRCERVDAWNRLNESFGDSKSEAAERAKAFREEQNQRKEEIQHWANSDLEGVDADPHAQARKTRGQRRLDKVKHGLQLLTNPLATFDKLMRYFGEKFPKGEGNLFNFVRKAVDARDSFFKKRKALYDEMDSAVERIGGLHGQKIDSWHDVYTLVKKLPTLTVNVKGKDYPISQGQATYLVAMDAQTDGRMKLRAMGITEADMDALRGQVDPLLLDLQQWVVGELLPGMRKDLNQTHLRMFGADMSDIANYFPIRTNELARNETVNLAQQNGKIRPATITGSIIERKRNNADLDITTDFFQTTAEHVSEMEHWNSFAELSRDLNTLLSYKNFRAKVHNMSSLRYGDGKQIWDALQKCCAITTGDYIAEVGSGEKIVNAATRKLAQANIALRVYTAAKQLLSSPVYLAQARWDDIIKNIANPMGTWKWAIENLPTFAERWQGRVAGDPILTQSDKESSVAGYKYNKAKEGLARAGYFTNAAVDAMTVAIGGRSIYETKLRQYKEMGYSDEDANKRALQDAAISVNETQQSGIGTFLSPIQQDRTFWSRMVTLYRNASMGFQRELVGGLTAIKNGQSKTWREEAIRKASTKMIREGIDADVAQRVAERMANREAIRGVAWAAMFGSIAPAVWALGGQYFPYKLSGGDDNEEENEGLRHAAVHLYSGCVEGLVFGQTLGSAAEFGIDYARGKKKFRDFGIDMDLFSESFEQIGQKMDGKRVEAIYDLARMFVSMGVGVDPKTIVDPIVGIMDFFGNDYGSARDFGLLFMRIMNVPQSAVDQTYIDELGMTAGEAQKLPAEELARKWATYKRRKGAGPLNAFTSEEYDKEIEDKYVKRFEKMMDARLDLYDGARLDEAMQTADPFVKKHLVKKVTTDSGIEYRAPRNEQGRAYEQLGTKEDVDLSNQFKQRFESLDSIAAGYRKLGGKRDGKKWVRDTSKKGTDKEARKAYKEAHKDELDKAAILAITKGKIDKKKAELLNPGVDQEAIMQEIRKLQKEALDKTQ